MENAIQILNPIPDRRKKILFLGYDRSQTQIIDALIAKKCEVHYCDQKVDSVDYDLIISFGYRHLIKSDFLNRLTCPILNLHISYLPYNKGAHPCFWSFYEGTPSGVTIHLIDEGIDTGDILFQKYVDFDKGEKTFKQAYKRLIDEIESLFLENIDDIIDQKWTALKQVEEGTLHYVADLPKAFLGWDSVISEEISRLHRILNVENF